MSEKLQTLPLKENVLIMIKDYMELTGNSISNKKLAIVFSVPRNEIKRIRQELVRDEKLKPGE